MRNLKTLSVLLFATLGGVTSAHAGAGLITTTVEPLSPAVTYSSTNADPAPSGALITHVGYRVTIRNDGGNTVNNIRFTGTTTVTDPQEAAIFSSAEGATCVTTNAAKTAISCSIGQLTAKVSYPTFAVFFRAPAKDGAMPVTPNGIAGACDTTDCVKFSGAVLYAEGTGGLNSPPDNSIKEWSTGDVTLGTFNPTLVKSGVPKAGGLYYTGNGAIPNGTDKFATSVKVPASIGYTTVEILETASTDPQPPPALTPCTNTYFYTCYQSDITVPLPADVAAFDYLTIVLRQAKENIKPGTKIESIVIYYLATPNSTPIIIGDCASPTTPNLDYTPCIAKRTYYKSSKVEGYTDALDGAFEWLLIGKRNGSYRFPV